MQRKCYIKTLTLVNLKLTERHIDLLIDFIKESKFLVNLDLSWCEVRNASFAKLLATLAENKSLVTLKLRWNTIFEERKQSELNEE